MYLRRVFRAVIASLVLSVSLQSVSFAGTVSHQATIQAHGHSSGSHHHHQPPAVKGVPTVNVRDFGATGDGVTDDTAAIQNAIAAAQASGKGVLFPAGTYLHASVITANSVPLFGVGGASTLLANNSNSTAVILTGNSPSIQNLVVSSAPAGTGVFDQVPIHATLLVQAAQNFIVQGITIVQGVGRIGVFVQSSAVGNVSGVTLNGTGSTLTDVGIVVDGCANVSLLGNLLLNEWQSIQVGNPLYSPFTCTSIAVIANTISTNVASAIGILTNGVQVLDVSQNQIQVGSQATSAIFISSGNNNLVAQNVTSGGAPGVHFFSNGSGNVITQNTIRDCAGSGVVIQANPASGNVQFVSNQFGECGTLFTIPVAQFIPIAGPDSITVLNNVYAGHQNALTFFIFNTAHLSLVSGNAQVQTALPNNLP